MEDNNWYKEWLLKDRLNIIDDTILKQKKNFKIVLEGNIYRNLVLIDLFRTLANKYKNGCGLNDEDPVIVSAGEDESENDNVQCAEFDSQHRLVKLCPLKVCPDSWIMWYMDNKMPSRSGGL